MATRKRTRKTVRNKKMHKQRHLGAWGIIVIVLAVFGVSAMGGIRLRQKNQTYQAREEALLEAIAEEEARAEEIADFEAYTKTKKYVEDVAKERLGLVYEDEIIFKPNH